MQRPPMAFDCATGRLEGATALERCAALAFQAGSKVSALFDHRGFSIGCRMVSSLLDKRDIVLRLNEDARFAFPFGDGYWSLLLDRKFTYEGEVARFLRSVADVDYTFVDGGANFGFWSVLVSSRPFGSHPVIAIEASSKNAAQLARNAELNDGRFKILHRAIGSTTGGHAWLSGQKHEAIRIVDVGVGDQSESVKMIALDSLVDDGLLSLSRKLIIKLDVEGMEIEAIKGGKRVSAAETVIIVEEHGADRAHTVSRHILNDSSFRLFVLDPKSERYERLFDLAMLDRIKTNRSIGYNVFATQSQFWEERIRSVPVPTQH